MKLEELTAFDGIITVSGDGLPHEVVNALFSREDWREATQVPVGVLPGGSGNALATSICKRSEMGVGVTESAVVIAKGHVREIDLMAFEVGSRRVFSFLSFSWAYIADCDLNSEHLRFMGGARFEVYGTWRALFQKSYRADVQVTRGAASGEAKGALFKEDTQWEQLNAEEFRYFLVTNMPYISENFYSSPLSEMDDGKAVHPKA